MWWKAWIKYVCVRVCLHTAALSKIVYERRAGTQEPIGHPCRYIKTNRARHRGMFKSHTQPFSYHCIILQYEYCNRMWNFDKLLINSLVKFSCVNECCSYENTTVCYVNYLLNQLILLKHTKRQSWAQLTVWRGSCWSW